MNELEQMNNQPQDEKQSTPLQNQGGLPPQDQPQPSQPWRPYGYNGTNYAPPPPTPQAPPRKKPTPTRIDTIFAWASVIVGILFVRTLPVVENTLGALLFTCLLFAFGMLYLHFSKLLPREKRDRVWIFLGAAAPCLLALGMVTGANSTIQRLLFAGLLCAFLYWIYCACGLAGRDVFGESCFYHAARAVFATPWLHLDGFFVSLPRRRSKAGGGKLAKTVGWIALGLGIAVIPTVIVLVLLSSDKLFGEMLEGMLDRLFSVSLDGFFETFGDIFFGCLTAMLLFAAMIGCKTRRDAGDGEKPHTPRDLHRLPKVLLCAAVTPMLLVYVLFFASQWEFYISAFTHVLPGDLTYAEYARSGFFELCWVCVINAAMLLAFNLLIKQKEGERGVLRAVYSAVISLFTLVLIATALAKLVLYIDTYGLTQKRVYAAWLMLLLAAAFVIVLIRQVCKKLPTCRALVVTCLIFVALIALPDVDGMIANYNVDAYLSGSMDEIDIESAASYGVSSVPALVKLRNELIGQDSLDQKQNAMLGQLDFALYCAEQDLEKRPDNFFTFNIPAARARALLKEFDTES